MYYIFEIRPPCGNNILETRNVSLFLILVPLNGTLLFPWKLREVYLWNDFILMLRGFFRERTMLSNVIERKKVTK